MKNLIIVFFSAIVFLFACECETPHSAYSTQWSSSGKDSIVHVQYYDNQTDHLIRFYMEYKLFSMLFNQGGYGSCYNYYQSHPADFTRERYSYYNSYYDNYIHPTKGYSVSSNSNGLRSYSSPSRSYSNSTSHSNSDFWHSNTNRSYSSPSRSSSGSSYNRSYSSPSRSYNSPSRSYSSPSRSYSSPSRSYSSPSRSYSSPSRSYSSGRR